VSKEVKKSQTNAVVPIGCAELLKSIKEDVGSSQIRAAISVNSELLKLYCTVGERIVQKQKQEGWGAGIVERLSKDLRSEFPGIAGFSASNIKYMRAFYLAYSNGHQAAGELADLPVFSIPWFHNVLLLTRLKDNAQGLRYAQKVLTYG
jgi:hypothetical protein